MTIYRDEEIAKRILLGEYPHADTHDPSGIDPLPLDYGQSFQGTVSGIAGAPKFQCSNLVGFGDEYFKGYWAYVVWDADGLGAAPQGEMLECTGYSSATGDFTVAAYSVAIAVGDKVLFLSEAQAAVLNGTFGLAALQALLAAITPAGPTTIQMDAAIALCAQIADGWDAALATILDNFSAARIGYLDQLDFNLAEAIAAITTAGPTNAQMETARDAIIAAIPAMVGTDGAATVADGWDAALATILDNFTALRIGYLDQLDFALQEAIAAITTAGPTNAQMETARDAIIAAIPAMVGTDGAALAASWTAALATALGSYTAVRGGYLDELAAANLPTDITNIKAETDQLPNVQHETEWSSAATIQALADAAATALTAGSITPTYPTGATRTRAILIATIHVANKTAAAHHIKFKVEGQKAAGGYGDLLNLTAQEGLSMVDVDGATDGWSGAIDVTTLVDASGAAYDFRFEVDSDNAGNVIYICSFVLALVYTM